MKKQLRSIRAYKADFKRIKRETERATRTAKRKVDTAEILHSALDLYTAFVRGELVLIAKSEEAPR